MALAIVSFISTMAFSEFQDSRTDARNAAVRGNLGGMRTAIAIARANIALKENIGVPIFPTYTEVSANALNASHPISSGTSIMNLIGGFPGNPWTKTGSTATTIYDCSGLAKGSTLNSPNNNIGWCYNEQTGEFWANSASNGGGAGNTENNY